MAEIIAKSAKKYGTGTIGAGSDVVSDFPRIPTGVFPLDLSIAGGFPIGVTSSIYGPACVSSSTVLRIKKGDKRNGGRDYTIEEAYRKFRRIGKGRVWKEDIPSYIFSSTDLGIRYNKIKNIYYSGVKETFTVSTEMGNTIRTTKEHKFLTKNRGYIELNDLRVGDSVLTIKKGIQSYYIDSQDDRLTEECLKYYPYGNAHIVGGYTYKRVHFARLVIEAALNNIDVEIFIDILKNNEELSNTLKYLPKDSVVHHIDSNKTNDVLSNLLVCSVSEHSKIHSIEDNSAKYFPNHSVIVEDKIIAIVNYGKERTYDVEMYAPYHNFVAQNFIVHNSGGKSTLVNRVISGAQNMCWSCNEYLWDCKCNEKRPQKVVLVHLESMDRIYSEAMGVNMEELIVVEPKIGEEAVDIIMECIRSDDCGLVVLDSLAMLTSTDEMDGSAFDKSIGLQARLISSMMRKLKTNMVRERKRGHNVAFIATNQIRAKIGGYGNQTEDVPGGYAAKHDWHLTLRVSQLTSPHIDKETEMPMYARFKASNVALTNKRKCYMLYGSAEYFITTSRNAPYSVGTIFDYTTTFTHVNKAGLLEKGVGKWRCNLQPDNLQESREKLIESWEQNPKLYLSLKKKIVDYVVDKFKKGDVIEFQTEGEL